MKDIFLRKLRAYAAVRTHLNQPEHKPIWFNQKPQRFTTLEAQFEAEAGDLGAFGDSQSQTLTGVIAGQNLAEKELEDAAHPLARAFRLERLAAGDEAQAAVWDLTLTDWRRLQEAALLEKARALLAALLPLTTGTPPPGEDFGITTVETDELSDLIDDYAAVLGQPIAARSGRKAKTAALRPHFRVLSQGNKHRDKGDGNFGAGEPARRVCQLMTTDPVFQALPDNLVMVPSLSCTSVSPAMPVGRARNRPCILTGLRTTERQHPNVPSIDSP